MSEVWFLDLKNIDRLNREREVIAQLEKTVSWLQGIHWKFNGQLCLEAILDLEGISYEVQMIYPDLFPALPPSVYPKDPEIRWSSHQYGRGGPLCLEWRPDTWSPEVTGAQVLESAYKLLYLEHSSNSHPPQIAPSDHKVSVGQDLRGSIGRLYCPSALSDCLHRLPNGAEVTLKFSITHQNQSFLVLIHEIRVSGSKLWQDNSIVNEMSPSSKNSWLGSGLVYVTSLSQEVIKDLRYLSDLEEVISQLKLSKKNLTAHNIWPSESEKYIRFAILVDATGQFHFFIWFNQESNRIHPLSLLESRYNLQNPRIPKKLQNLSSKSIAIIGLGSVGSKIAVSLARTGIKHFHLVDDDIFLPENICRNALDWRNVGEHKVNAIHQVLSYISCNIKVDCSVLNIGGQESSALLDRTLRKLSQCNLIIDATANPTVFNLLTSVSLQYEKPLLWIEVFAGGIGGMIARSRPKQDPSPNQLRAAYAQFTSFNPFPEDDRSQNYELTDREGDILSAIDAEVEIIAGHATRLAIDTIAESSTSIYPHSMYLIGFKQAWVFHAPFDTIPITIEPTTNEKIEISTTSEVISDNLNFLSEILKDAKTEGTSS